MSFPLLMGLAALCAAAGIAILAEETIARRRTRRDDLEALIEATRDQIPDCVPDEWVQEFRQ